MEKRHTSSQIKSILGAALAGFGLVIVFRKLDGPALHLTDLLGVAVRETLELLLSFVPAACQALQAHFDHREYSPCPLQMLVSFWPLLRVMAGAA
jgi:hypothetical protein